MNSAIGRGCSSCCSSEEGISERKGPSPGFRTTSSLAGVETGSVMGSFHANRPWLTRGEGICWLRSSSPDGFAAWGKALFTRQNREHDPSSRHKTPYWQGSDGWSEMWSDFSNS